MTKNTNKINPIPTKDDIIGLDKKSVNQPWELWFRKLYDVVLGISNVYQGTVYDISSTSATPVEGFNYCLDGNRYFFNYKGTGDVEVVLPFPILYDVEYSWGSFKKGQRRIQFPVYEGGITINEWFFLDLD